MQKQLHVVVSGRVQGVGYRIFAVEHGLSYNLTGWVRNLYGGDVEVLAEGQEKDLLSFLADLETGPTVAKIINTKVDWNPFSGQFQDFLVRSTWISD